MPDLIVSNANVDTERIALPSSGRLRLGYVDSFFCEQVGSRSAQRIFLWRRDPEGRRANVTDGVAMWWSLSMNPQVVLSYYTSPPALLGVEIHSLRMHRDGPILEMVADLPHSPDKLPSKWPAGANTAQIGLRFLDVKEVVLSGWGRTNIGDIMIAIEGESLRFRIECPTMRLSGVAKWFDIQHVSGYVRGVA